MNWNQFLLSLLAIYFIYYMLNVLFDLLRPKTTFAENRDHEELVFSELEEPETVSIERPITEEKPLQPSKQNDRQVISSGPLQTTGGVNLKQLFSLAQSDLIEYTKAIPY